MKNLGESMKVNELKDLLKKYCTTKEEQQVIEDAYTRLLDEYDPQMKESNGFHYFNAPGVCSFCGRLTCRGECFK
jgi:hypothetical protein